MEKKITIKIFHSLVAELSWFLSQLTLLGPFPGDIWRREDSIKFDKWIWPGIWDVAQWLVQT